MKIKELAEVVEMIAPLQLAQDWDNVGLLVGDSNSEIKNIMLTIDVTKDVVAEAKKKNIDLILSYHPIIWDGLKSITNAGESQVVYQCIKAGINVFSIHTAFDVADGGVNDLLAEILGIENAQPIGDFVDQPGGVFYKFITFVPEENVNQVADAIYKAGAGAIGNYSNCGFESAGTGTFLPSKDANPAIGKPDKTERVNEIKLESIVPENKITDVIAAMRSAHPYETPAFDVFRHYDCNGKLGLGRIGKLKTPLTMPQIIENIKKTTGADAVGIIGKQRRTVKKAAVCAGSCGPILNSVMAQNADLYLTGELKHHMALAAQEAGLTCICLSHTVSERFALKNIAKRLKKQLKDVTICLSKKDADPFKWKNI